MFSLFVTLLLVGISFSQNNVATAVGTIDITVASAGLTLDPAAVSLADLIPGKTYTLKFDATAMDWGYYDPVSDPANLTFPGVGPFVLSAYQPGATVLIDFNWVSDKLVSDVGIGAIGVNYLQTGVRDGTIGWLAPFPTFSIETGFGGATYEFLPEMVFTLPNNLTAGATYYGIMVCNASYTGF